jgi:O-antigen/teichoic acid export membrane protein
VQRQHRAVWLGNLLFLATSLVLNLIFIPWIGLMGLGVAAIVSAIMLAVWRSFTLNSGKGAATGQRKLTGALAWFAASGGEDPAAG